MAYVLRTEVMATRIRDDIIQEFRTSLSGQLLLPEHPSYNDVRKVWNAMVDKRPALIVRCMGAADVIKSISFARTNNLLVSVRGGGHNVAGKAVCEDDGIMIDLSLMKGIWVDPSRKVAHAQPGLRLGEFDRETQAFGLATTLGVISNTGIAGLTLGGGVGRLARKYGLACDNLLSVDLVTADGQVVRSSVTENSDLFWGVRGAGANFGVVTSFEFQLHPVGPGVLGGVVVHSVENARAALKFYYEYSRSAPDELSADAAFLTSRDGDPVLAISVCYIGPIEQGERVLAPLRRFGPPLADEVGPVAYTEVQAAADAFFPIGLHYYWKSHFLEVITDDAIEATVDHFANVPSPRSLIVFQQYGGAVSRIAHAASAFRHRDAQYDNFAASIWTDPREQEIQQQWVREWWGSMKPFSIGAEYVNNLGDE